MCACTISEPTPTGCGSSIGTPPGKSRRSGLNRAHTLKLDDGIYRNRGSIETDSDLVIHAPESVKQPAIEDFDPMKYLVSAGLGDPPLHERLSRVYETMASGKAEVGGDSFDFLSSPSAS